MYLYKKNVMSKVVKIKQSDIERIVENIVSNEMDKENSIAKEEETTEDIDNQGGEKFMVAKSEDGKFAVINIKTGEVLGMK
jgi:hypothetical protein